jgi:Tol biopolymer transport system component
MMPTERFERQLPGLLEDLAEPQTPDYFDDLLWQTAGTSQRPAWTLLERWFPMLIARQPVLAPRLPWRPILTIALIGLLLLATAAFYAGMHHLPPPFGVAKNGLVVYSENGDLFTTDPATGVVATIVTGPDFDLDPVFSPDGTKLAFERKEIGTTGPGWLYIANANGGGLTRISPAPLTDLSSYQFSSDGRWVVMESTIGGFTGVSVAESNGNGYRRIDTAGHFLWSTPTFRPGDDSTLLFVGAQGADGSYPGLYLVDRDGTQVRTLIKADGVADSLLPDAAWSPDGSQIAYTQSEPNQLEFRVHVMTVDASGKQVGTDRVVGHAPAAWFEGWPVWSPDGHSLLVQRNTGPVVDRAVRGADYDASVHPPTAVIVSVDGTAPEVSVKFELSTAGALMTWAPDGKSVLVTPYDGDATRQQQLLWDPTTGTSTKAPWTANSYPSWQRLAP